MITTTINKEVQSALTPEDALKNIMQGNERFTAKTMLERDYASQRNAAVLGQSPKAVILSCIDSRVPVETIFDQGIGDLFVARVAGNFENVDILGSLEYSCKVAESKLVMVLGHESCGAVKAACDGVELGNITSMLSNIMPAVKIAAQEVEGETNSSNKAFVAQTVAQNVRLTIERIRAKSPILKEMEAQGEIKIVGGIYALSSGKVTIV